MEILDENCLENVEILECCHFDFMGNPIWLIKEDQKMAFLTILEAFNLDFCVFHN